MDQYDEQSFRNKVDQALATVRTILANERQPDVPAEVPHTYDDKYKLAEFVTKLALGAELNCLEALGVKPEGLQTFLKWGQEKATVTLRFKAEEKCELDRKETRKEESKTRHETSISIVKVVDKTVTTIDEWFWNFEAKWAIFAYKGTDVDSPVVLNGRSGTVEIVTRSEAAPYPKMLVRDSIDVDISWLVQHLIAKGVQFKIDRTDEKKCHTPRRNEDVEEALGHYARIHQWARQVVDYLTHTLFPVQPKSGKELDMRALNADAVFVPVIPCFEARDNSPVVAEDFAAPFLAEEQRTLRVRFEALGDIFPHPEPFTGPPPPKKEKKPEFSDAPPPDPRPMGARLITSVEASVVVALMHTQRVCVDYGQGVDYVEDMIRKQLIAAIGKIINAVDFTAYMDFHNRRLFKPAYAPVQLSYAIRRPDHYPEGTVQITAVPDGSGIPEPINTLVAVNPSQAMTLELDASTHIAFGGPHYVHAFLAHQFSGHTPQRLALSARARQFSSFIMMVGTIGGAHLFQPKYAIIVQNKDELDIPLMCETIPAPKAFRDAIESLSPEMQRFAKAYRSLQLEGTLFGVVVIQIKPALEQVLNLPDDSLTKEIKLTQDLLSLFIEYQIPSDLLSYAGAPEASTQQKLDTVRGYVNKMNQMLDAAKKEEIAEARRIEEMRRAEELLRERERQLAEQKRREEEERQRHMEEERRRSEEDRMIERSVKFESSSVKQKSGGGILKMLSKSRDKSSSSMRREMASGPAINRSVAPQVFPSAPAPSPSIAPMPPRDEFSKLRSSLGAMKPAEAESVASPKADKGPKAPKEGGQGQVPGAAARDAVDYTKIPSLLDKEFEMYDEEGAVRATTITPSKSWTRKAQKALLAAPTTGPLEKKDQKVEKNKAYDLLDALSKSGGLTLQQAELHILLASTHCFDQTLMDTLIKDNVNPIEKVERSMLILASTIHGKEDVSEMISPDQLDRVRQYSPALFDAL